MRTIKLTIEYDGTNYCGWQIQKNGRSVQGELTKAIRKMTGEKTSLIGASRTDAGVHAFGQVAHFKTEVRISPEGFRRGINSEVNSDIAVVSAEEVSNDFHAQKSAVSKLYQYVILTGDVRPAILRDRCWYMKEELNLKAMKKTAKYFVGEHDFKNFQSTGSSARDAVRTVFNLNIEQKYLRQYGVRSTEYGVKPTSYAVRRTPYCILIEANAFVYHMVRNIVGALVEVGKGRLAPECIDLLLRRTPYAVRNTKCAPACGLYLVKVDY